MTELGKKLTVEVNHYRNLWRVNYAAAVLLFFGALVSSGLATLFAATGAHPQLLPWLTAAPGVILLANGFLKLHQRYAWNVEKSNKLRAVLNQVEFGGTSDKVAVDWWNKVDEEMGKSFPCLENLRSCLARTRMRSECRIAPG
jgi:hypothetical protein